MSIPLDLIQKINRLETKIKKLERSNFIRSSEIATGVVPHTHTGTSGVVDPDSIHNNVNDEFGDITNKGSPTGSDKLLIEDAAASDAKKHILISSFPANPGNDTTAIHDNQNGEFGAITTKGTPIGADRLLIEDQADTYAKKKITLSTLFNVLLLDEDNMASNSTIMAATQQSLKAYVDAGDSDPNDTDAIHDNVNGEFSSIANKGTPIGADRLLIEDYADTYAKKRITLANLSYYVRAEVETFVIKLNAQQIVGHSRSDDSYIAPYLLGGTEPYENKWATNDGGAGIQTFESRGITIPISSLIPCKVGYVITITEVKIRLNNNGGGSGENLSMYYRDWDDSDTNSTVHQSDTTIGTAWETVTFGTDLTLYDGSAAIDRAVAVGFMPANGWCELGGAIITYTVARA